MAKVSIDMSNIPESPEADGHHTSGGIWADQIELLRTRANILTGQDRALMQMHLEAGQTFTQIARLMQVNETTIARRIHNLTKRLLQGEYITCLRHRQKLALTEQIVARDYFLQGISQKQIAIKRGMSLYQVRKNIERIRRVVDDIERQKRKTVKTVSERTPNVHLQCR